MRYNDTIKNIRLKKGLPQKAVVDGALSQSNYSKYENGQLEITVSSFIGIIDNLDLDLEEFIFIHNGYNYSQKQNIFRSFFHSPVNSLPQLHIIKNKCTEFLSKKHDLLIQQIYTLCDAYIIMNEKKDISYAHEVAEGIVNDFIKKDTLFIKDIYIINSIFFVFSLETAHLTMKYIKSNIKKYQDFHNINKMIVNLTVNYSLMLIKAEMYKEALEQIESALIVSKQYKLSVQTAILLIRKSICMNQLNDIHGNEFLKKGLLILEVLEEWNILELGKQEVSKYCPPPA